MPSVLSVCRNILHIGREKEINDISPMKLIKLAYICQGFHLAYYNEPLFPERAQAWKFGPVIREIYDEVKGYGRDPVHPRHFDDEEEAMDERAEKVLWVVFEVYSQLSAAQLSALTHHQGTPWYVVREKMRTKNNNIPHFLIREHYRKDILKYD